MSHAPEFSVSPAAGCAIKPKNLPRPNAVKVNGVVISRDAIARETQNHPAPKPVEAWKAAARALVVRELLLQEARHQALAASPLIDAEGRRETDEEALIRTLVEETVTTPEPDEMACRRVYDANASRFGSPDIFEVRHILLAAAPGDAARRSAAMRQAEVIIGELTADPSRFADLAALHSDCPSAAQGGSLGQISDGQTVPEFESALRQQGVGTVSTRPIESRYGLHVVVVDRRIPGAQLPFEIVRSRIAAWLTEKSRHISIHQFIAELARRSTIEGIEFDLTSA